MRDYFISFYKMFREEPKLTVATVAREMGTTKEIIDVSVDVGRELTKAKYKRYKSCKNPKRKNFLDNPC